MKTNPLSPGLRWKKLDLHVHTPASADFDKREMSAAEFVSTALEKGVDGIAITDHNTGEWIDKVVEAAKGRLAILPGVEITAAAGREGGIHVIALFDVTATTKTVENLLGALDIRAEKYGKPEAFTQRSVEDVIEMIAERDGLAVLAHADSTRGLLHDSKGESRIGVLVNPHLAAVEVHDFPKYRHMLDGTDANYTRKLAVYRSSDNRSPIDFHQHSADGIGSRFTRFKMDDITLESLRQCFCDPDVRIRADDTLTETLGQEYAHIAGITVSQGFFGGKEFSLHEGLNSIVGGKGVGKSLLIEFLRFALDQVSPTKDIRDDLEGKLHDQLRPGGQVTVIANLMNGQRIIVERTYDGANNPSRVWYEDSKEVIDGRISEIFPILAYSQAEAVEIAKDEDAQLKLIDRFIDLGSLRREKEEIHRLLGRLDRKLADSITANLDRKTRRTDLATITAQRKQLEKTLVSPRFGELQKLEPRTTQLLELTTLVEASRTFVDDFQAQIASLALPTLPDSLQRDAGIKKMRKALDKLLANLRGTAASLASKTTRATEQMGDASAAWDKTVKRKTAEYEKWLETVGGANVNLMSKRQKLKKDAEKLEKEIISLDAKVSVFKTVRDQRRDLLDRLANLADRIYRARAEAYATLTAKTGGRIRLELLEGVNRQQFADSLMQFKRGSRLRERDVQVIASKIHPREFVDLVIDQDSKTLAKKTDLDPTMAEKLNDTLNTQDDFAEVLSMQHLVWPEDKPVIQYLKEDGKYYDLATLSMGQKCTALLVIALTEGRMPVIIDQPEDALDIPTVYRDITLQLRERKDNRQFILTTHNPTVAVTGDSDKFVILKGTATDGALAAEGAIERDRVREEVISHLEGGRDSYDLKSRKYGVRGT